MDKVLNPNDLHESMTPVTDKTCALTFYRWFWRKEDLIVKQVGTFAVASICIASISVQSGKVGETRTGFQNRKQKKKKKTQNFQSFQKELEELGFALVKHDDKHLCRPALLAGNNKDLAGVAWQSSVHSDIAFFLILFFSMSALPIILKHSSASAGLSSHYNKTCLKGS
ncbi:hypothetical protein METSCH_E02690 [Metschnikowia aff. pulcherrima]|uniref:Uncharacterized protein n=1 Tax=Metschnikowia aff. pulcherrima TaxID=2163413 RepID=A0A4P6XRF1_9ASCO|nr:hypothetical protein METSCH_E02690 [Metschnikowia aff. pulcherrima]